jgi:hypothetical protein
VGTQNKIFGKFLYLSYMKKIIKLTESDLTRIVKRVIKENESESGKYLETLLKFVDKQFKGMKRDRWGWDVGEKNVLQYVNNHFIVNEDLRDEIKKVFGISDREVHQLYKIYLKKRFPRYNMFNILYEYL